MGTPSVPPDSTPPRGGASRIEGLLRAAVYLQGEERAEYLARACRNGAERAEVERLLGQESPTMGVPADLPEGAASAVGAEIEAPRDNAVAAVNDAPRAQRVSVLRGFREGTQVGSYRLLSVLGEGGFGVVWLAERREPYVQRVALKIIKPGMDSKAVLARFEQERQALAVMNHPNVAKVLDGGVTEDGRPYFVMEHVRGEPVTTFCDRHRLTVRQRLELFVPVCEAVQHAHMKGIIHRDIKPGNILVSFVEHAGEHTEKEPRGGGAGIPGPAGGAGVVGQMLVKVIDFGVAKAICHTLTDKTIFTEQGQIIGTPEYMSPEQAEMGAVDIDTRTDVYALGVVLYELLAGVLPFDAEELRSKGYAEIQRIIREVEAPKPSTRLSRLGDAAKEVAHRRQEEREHLARELGRELEWIPLKAMRKDRSRRYSTAMALGEDVQRYLRGQALIAGPESIRYRVRVRVERWRRPLAAALLLGGAVVGPLAGDLAFYSKGGGAWSRALAVGVLWQSHAATVLALVLSVHSGRSREEIRWAWAIAGVLIVSFLGVGYARYSLPKLAALDLPSDVAELRAAVLQGWPFMLAAVVLYAGCARITTKCTVARALLGSVIMQAVMWAIAGVLALVADLSRVVDAR